MPQLVRRSCLSDEETCPVPSFGNTLYADICRVCRSEGTPEKPLYHPCVCTGSIKFIHQECLVQWLKHSRKEYCELCKHRFAFTPIYSPDMPSRLPIQDIFAGLVTSIGTAIRYWFHYTLVAFAWLGVVPLTACRIYKCLFTGSVSSLLTLPLDILSTENLLADCLQGCFVVTCTLCAFISLVWLREQIVHGGAPQWLEQNHQQPLNGVGQQNEAQAVVNGGVENAVLDQPANPAAENAVVGENPEIQEEQVDEEEEDNEDEEDAVVEDAADANNGAQDDMNWNALEWDRAAEELTWERMLGLDGSLVFLVSLLVVVEIGVFPLICGWWLDICSLEMFDATLKDRELSFQSAPGTTMFLHWLVGMVYVFYFASFILLLREVLRPGVLWFLRNLNDPDFNPVQEMIHLPIYRHLRRFILSVIVFGSIVLLMLWLPIRIIKYLLPNFLPYNVMLYSDAPVSELSLELLLLQVVLPALLEQGHTRQWLKGLVRAWTVTAGYLLDLHSYLLGDQEENENNANQQPNNQHARNNNAIPVVGEGLHAAHQAILQQGGPVGFQPYRRPLKFPLRIFLLIVFMCITLLIASLICLTLPVFVFSVFAGRWLMSFWTGTAKIHELYTAACGLYVCWLTIRAVTVLVAWMPQGRRVIFQKVKEWSLMIMKTLIVAILLAGVVPLLLGLLFELVIVAPLRVPLDQTPLFYPWQDWALGVLHAKIIAAITLMGPQWWLKTVIEQVYANGIRNIDLHFIIRKLAAPVISVLLLSLCVPYIIASGVVPLLGVTAEMQNLVQRRIYPFLLMVVVLMGILSFQVRQFKRLYEHIKNDKYLVGQRLVNYERKSGKQGTSTTPPQSSQE
ncbi:E3 ubiquitin-protein ligase MARCH6 isoform X10 [Strigops habroptila]|uniref:E3 ubiquitin-protein ligase MARCH6 isoform X10 n=1 Tax=Strigops habroptila TaxID=2489341 RepID=UPI0011CFB78D|nr:E3 ubiquitin-protein ligase MARCH6 isoform X10 [Strigops habroptila]